MSDYIACTNNYHNFQSGSSYNKQKVPISLFVNQRTGFIYKSCLDCRNVKNSKAGKDRKIAADNYQKLKDQHDEDIKNNKKFVTCPSKTHNNASRIPRNNVPIENFKKYPTRKISSYLVNCLDCCVFIRNQYTNNKNKLLTYSEINNITRCTRCEQIIDDSEKVIGVNDTILLTCKSCKDKLAIYVQNGKNNYNQLKYELILKNETCCRLCNSLFIVDENNLNIVIEIPSFINNNIRYCQYKNITYKTLDFINLYIDIISISILEFDHMTECEQREIGYLTLNDVYEPKITEVSTYQGKENMLYESKKCQLICGKCHVIETIKREKGVKELERPIETRRKLKYCNELKKLGCTNCHYINHDLPRFFHFDHIDPVTKIANISKMIFKSKYSYEDMINELKKTRILCKYCHYIVTQNQHKQGLLRTKTHNIEI